MPHASHRIVGVIELESTVTLDESNSFRQRSALTGRAMAAAIRRIAFELSDSRSTPHNAFETTVKVDSAKLQRDLEAELSGLLAKRGSLVLG
ncbi:MAG: hypothetical protein H6822_34090 [Planctomycetaceae bacterium]|nr:hypothetical protein [Planctomycetales bacterium]MCB9927217.1 hypothetical protein [Planctomycetaceae bacterium]